MRQRSARTQSARLRTQWLAWCCALSLLALQGLGLWHRTVHQPASAVALQTAAADEGNTDSLGHKIGSSECQLFDHLTPFDLLCSSATPLLPLAPVAGVQPSAATGRALQYHWSRGARGPPTLA